MTTRRPRRDAHRAAGTPTTLRARNSNARESVPSVLLPVFASVATAREATTMPNPDADAASPEARERDVDPAPERPGAGRGADARAIPERAATPGRGARRGRASADAPRD